MYIYILNIHKFLSAHFIVTHYTICGLKIPIEVCDIRDSNPTHLIEKKYMVVNTK